MTETVEETSTLVWPIFMLRIEALRELNPIKYRNESNVNLLIQNALEAQKYLERDDVTSLSEDAEALVESFKEDLLRGVVDRKGNLFKDPMKSEVMRVAEGYDYPLYASKTVGYAANVFKDRGVYTLDYESITPSFDTAFDTALREERDLYFRQNMLPISRFMHNALIESYQIGGAGEEDKNKRYCLRRYLQRSEEAWQDGYTATLDNDGLKLSEIYEKLEQQEIIDHKGEIVDPERFATSPLLNGVDAWSGDLKKVGLRETEAFKKIMNKAKDAGALRKVNLEKTKKMMPAVMAAANEAVKQIAG